MWLNIAAKLVPGILKTGMSIASNRRKTKELESVAELKLAERMLMERLNLKKPLLIRIKKIGKTNFALYLFQSLYYYWLGLYLVMIQTYRQK